MQPPLPKPEPSPSTHIDARQNSSLAQHSQPRVKSEQVEQDLSGNDLYVIEEGDQELDFLVGMETEPYPNDLIVKQDDNDGQELGEPEPRQEVRTVRGGKRLLPGPHRRRDSLRAEHRRRLDALLNTFMREHRWKEAAAVLSVLLRWAPLAYNISDDELRRYYTVTMELHRRFFSGEERRYEMWIKQVFDIWMSRLSRSKDDSRKKNMLLMELALFYFTQGNIDEAHGMMH